MPMVSPVFQLLAVRRTMLYESGMESSLPSKSRILAVVKEFVSPLGIAIPFANAEHTTRLDDASSIGTRNA